MLWIYTECVCVFVIYLKWHRNMEGMEEEVEWKIAFKQETDAELEWLSVSVFVMRVPPELCEGG